MAANGLSLQSHTPKLPAPGEIFEWAFQAMRQRNWVEASRRWAVLREAYPKHPAPWVQGATAHIEAKDLETTA